MYVGGRAVGVVGVGVRAQDGGSTSTSEGAERSSSGRAAHRVREGELGGAISGTCRGAARRAAESI